MYYVYILHSIKDKNLYTGYSSDLKLRINEHNKGLVKSTKNRRPLELIYYEAYLNESNARRREEFYKSGIGREVLHKILKETLLEVNSAQYKNKK